jgi:hypothetical protein
MSTSSICISLSDSISPPTHTHKHTFSHFPSHTHTHTHIHTHTHTHTHTHVYTLSHSLSLSLDTSITVLGDVPHVALKGVAAGAISATLGCVQTGQSIDTVVCISIPKGMYLLNSFYYQFMREAIILNLTMRDF